MALYMVCDGHSVQKPSAVQPASTPSIRLPRKRAALGESREYHIEGTTGSRV